MTPDADDQRLDAGLPPVAAALAAGIATRQARMLSLLSTAESVSFFTDRAPTVVSAEQVILEVLRAHPALRPFPVELLQAAHEDRPPTGSVP